MIGPLARGAATPRVSRSAHGDARRSPDDPQIRWGLKGVHIMQMSKTGRALTGYRMTDRDHCTAHAHGYDVAVMEPEKDEDGDMTVIEMVTDVEEIGKVEVLSDSKEADRDFKRPAPAPRSPIPSHPMRRVAPLWQRSRVVAEGGPDGDGWGACGEPQGFLDSRALFSALGGCSHSRPGQLKDGPSQAW